MHSNISTKISVCVPVYATENVLKHCLCSIASQNFDSFEIVLVDDCSPGVQNSKLSVNSIVKEIQKEFSSVKIKVVQHKKNRSLLEARRTGFLNSSGKFITFVDSDDELLPNALSVMYENAIKNQADIVHCNSQIIFKDDEKPNIILDFGKKQIKTVAIISGGAGDDLDQAIAANVDLYITGELGHEQYHLARENNISVIAAGHYNTETVGVSLVMEKLTKDTGIEGVFIHSPTNM